MVPAIWRMIDTNVPMLSDFSCPSEGTSGTLEDTLVRNPGWFRRERLDLRG